MEAKHAIQEAAAGAKRKVEQSLGGPARFQVILVLACILGLDTGDKATISAVAGSLETVFHVGNTGIGLLISAVSFVGAVFTLPIGSLVDRLRRKTVLLWAIALWSAAMAVSGLATSYLFMLLTRLALGAVTAAASPSVASLTGDFFPARDRARVYGMILAGELVGTGIGFFIGGELSSWIDWRVPFFAMAVLGFALVWGVWRFLPEPARGGQSWISEGQEEIKSKEDVERDPNSAARNTPQDSGQAGSAAKAQETILRAGVKPREDLVLHEDPSKRGLWWAIRYMLRFPTYVLLIVASSLAYFFFAGVRAFGMIYLTQHYGVSRSTLSALVIAIGIGGIIGVVMGGWISEWFLRRGWFTTRVALPGITLFLSVLFFGPAIWTTSLGLGIILLTVGAAMLGSANPPIDAARLDIMHPRLWGRAESGRMALRATLEGGAPLLFGAVSTWLGGGNTGLEWTYLLMLIPLLIASSLAIPARLTYPRDVATAGASAKNTLKT
ncbi:MAG TPA: MFS transporter [Acetobacteraceae bacterium]|nr:MFS transporter [Acetobacteraceae bacterium]